MMASETEPTFPLKLLVDKERNHVVVAEATGDFVDILFSFLTLPLATIIRLVSKKQPAAEIGCISNLYKSVENFDTRDFWNHICKQMLLCPSNPCDALCQKLKLNLDDKQPVKYFMCSSCGGDKNGWLLSTFAETTCTCGRLMNQEMELEDSTEDVEMDGVFVKGKALYLMFDDLKVMEGSLGNSLYHLTQLGYKDLSNLIDMSFKVGLNEILDLLKQALTSKSPLTATFLAKMESNLVEPFCPKLAAKFEARNFKMNLKITVSKSKNKILYAEAEEDFIDFLLSFLTIPLGSILNQLDGNSSLGCIDNLYESVESLNPSWCQASCTQLLNPGVAPQFGCQNQPLNIAERDPPSYWFGTGVIHRNNICYSVDKGVISRRRYLIKKPEAMKLLDPRSPDGTKAIGFVQRPATFAVWDDLRVTPLTSNSIISFLQKLNIPLDDLDRHVVGIGEKEASNLLRASLTSKDALTKSLFLLLKKPKEEID